MLATISTTFEAILFESMASEAPREYSDNLYQGLLYSIFAMFVFTWAVVVLEVVIPVGRERWDERKPPRLLPPPPSLRLSLLGRFAPSTSFSRPGSSSRKTNMFHVQPSKSSLVVPRADSSDSSESERIEDGRQEPEGRGGKGKALVVPIEG